MNKTDTKFKIEMVKAEVVFGSLEIAIRTLNTFNSKQLLDEMRREDSVYKSNLSIKSIKFKYKVAEDGSESTVGVTKNESS